MALATGIVGLVTGYFIGQGSSIGLFGSSKKSEVTLTRESEEDELMEDEDDELGDTQQELDNFTGSTEECKLVLVVRTDLGMTKGIT